MNSVLRITIAVGMVAFTVGAGLIVWTRSARLAHRQVVERELLRLVHQPWEHERAAEIEKCYRVYRLQHELDVIDGR